MVFKVIHLVILRCVMLTICRVLELKTTTKKKFISNSKSYITVTLSVFVLYP